MQKLAMAAYPPPGDFQPTAGLAQEIK